jgi:hypothetical protein
MSETLLDLADHHRTANRAHYKCGHHADFRHGPAPLVGDFMICMVCLADTKVTEVERGVETPAPKRGYTLEEHGVCTKR